MSLGEIHPVSFVSRLVEPFLVRKNCMINLVMFIVAFICSSINSIIINPTIENMRSIFRAGYLRFPKEPFVKASKSSSSENRKFVN